METGPGTRLSRRGGGQALRLGYVGRQRHHRSLVEDDVPFEAEVSDGRKHLLFIRLDRREAVEHALRAEVRCTGRPRGADRLHPDAREAEAAGVVPRPDQVVSRRGFDGVGGRVGRAGLGGRLGAGRARRVCALCTFRGRLGGS